MVMNVTDRLLIPCSSWKTDMLGFRNRHQNYSSKSCILQVGNSSSSSSPLCDFLGANKLGKKYLIDAKQQPVPVESLRGKVLALYFAVPKSKYGECNYGGVEVPYAFIDFYNTLKLTKPDAAFEMIYVAPRDCDPSLFNAVVSTLPCLVVPDLDWRYYIFNLYNWYSWHPLVLVDTKDNRIRVFQRYRLLYYVSSFGPLYHPFTLARTRQLVAQSIQLGRETSISAILASDSCDYLLDPHYNKVPISSLQNKDVLIYGVQSLPSESKFEIQLGEIHNRFRNQGFEIVSVNLEYNGGNGEYEKSWEDHLAQISWLHLPVLGDEKIWLLRRVLMLEGFSSKTRDDPILFVKPKGESLLDPYGYQVLQMFGIQAFPFTRKAAAFSVATRLKGLSFRSFIDKASQFGFNFNSLIRNKADGGTELVSLSNILEGRRRGILILFASLDNCSRERLNSLIEVYLSQNESSSSSSFEVIFVSTDKDSQTFYHHFSVMPWFALQIPLEKRKYKELCEMIEHYGRGYYSHFLAFGPDQRLVQVGLLTKSFENCVFPLVNDAESSDQLAYSITHSFNWRAEADGTIFDEGNGWGRGIKNNIHKREDWWYGYGGRFG